MLRLPARRAAALCSRIASRAAASTRRLPGLPPVAARSLLRATEPTASCLLPPVAGLPPLRRLATQATPPAGSEDAAADVVQAEAPQEGRVGELKQLLALYKPHKRPLSVAFGALVIGTGTTMAFPAGIGMMVDLVTSEAGPAALSQLGGTLTAVFLLGAAANVGRVALLRIVGARITADLRSKTYSSLLAQELAFYDSSRTGELVNRLSADTTLLGETLSNNFSAGLRSVGQAVGGITLMTLLCPELTAVMLAVVPPVAVGARLYGQWVKGLQRDVQDKLSSATELAEERLSNIRTVRWFAREPAEAAAYSSRVQEVLSLSTRQALYSGAFFGGVDLAVKLSMLAVLWRGGDMVLAGDLSVGDLTSFLLYTVYVGVSSASLSTFYSDMMKGVGASQRVFQLMNRTPRVLSAGDDSDGHGSAARLPAVRGQLTFEDVRFSYPSRPDAAVLRGLSLRVQPGESLALVGASGSGKSTLAGLLARLYELGEGNGRILLDGRDVTSLDAIWLREQLGSVGQEPVLFAASIAENIAYGRPEATAEEVRAAAMEANAHDFIAAFPDGYDTAVGERGLSLSGGQKQRIAIARALLRNPAILVLDEATSALDPESEAAVQVAIERIKQGRTVLMISHRLSTIRSADKIAVLHEGRVEEQGSFDQLARSSNTFRQLILNKPPVEI